MKKIMAAGLTALMLLGSAQAMADGGDWVNSQFNGPMQLASYANGFDGYQSVDGFGGITAADPYFLTVISKSASIWEEPRTGSRKLGSASNGETLHARCPEGLDQVIEENGFYFVDYKQIMGWVNKDYVVRNTLEITLMESNVPAYIAPDVHSKKVGSLSKMTKLRVIGFYDDFYIVELRGGAAYIPMDVRHYDTGFESFHHAGMSFKGRTTAETKLRTGPGEDYPVIRDLPANYEFSGLNIVDGYYLIAYFEKEIYGYAYIDMRDAEHMLSP